MSRTEFFEIIEEKAFNWLTLADLRTAYKNGWISWEDAESLASIILDC